MPTKKRESDSDDVIRHRARMMYDYLMEQPDLALRVLGSVCERYKRDHVLPKKVRRPALSLVASREPPRR